MKKRNILKGASILLIAAVMIFSTTTVVANTSDQKVVAPLNRDVLLFDDFEDGDYTNNPTWTMSSFGNGNGLEDWGIKADPWTYAYGTVTNHDSGYFMGSDSDAGAAIADELMEIDFDTDGVGSMTLEYWLHFRSYISDIDEYFEVLIDDDQVDHISIPGTNPPPFEGIRTVDISAYNDGATHTLKMHYYADWGYVAAFDDVSIYSAEVSIPDLDCDGTLSWEEVTPGETVTGTFTVENIGDEDSLLDWEIESYPDWGSNWTFDPDGGTGLPKGVPVTVDVEVVAPEDPETNFTGEIVLVNSDDPDDTCIIDVALATPVSQQSLISLFFEMLAQRFPFLGRILAALF